MASSDYGARGGRKFFILILILFFNIRWNGDERGDDVIKIDSDKERLHDFEDDRSGHIRQGLPS